jgi:hypothetical protein
MSVGLKPPAIRILEFPQLVRLRFVGVNGEAFVDKKIPNLFSSLSSVKRFVLSVAYAAERFIGHGWLGSIGAPNDLDHAFALINLLPKNLTQISTLRAEDILPDWLVAEKSQSIGDELTRAPKLLADCRNKNCRAWRHRSDNSYQVNVDLTRAQAEQNDLSVDSSHQPDSVLAIGLQLLQEFCVFLRRRMVQAQDVARPFSRSLSKLLRFLELVLTL